jgi:hypothetical protein
MLDDIPDLGKFRHSEHLAPVEWNFAGFEEIFWVFLQS